MIQDALPSHEAQLGRVRRLVRFIGLDAAIALTIAARGFTVIGSVVTVLLILRFLSPLKQGFYYTIWSMVALQVVFELGFTFVVLQMAAHESAHLHLDESGSFHGPEAHVRRLASVLQKSLRWYFVAAIGMLLTLTPGGLLFFRMHQAAGTAELWRWPWIATVFASMFTLQMDPVYAFLEGCGQIKDVAKMRFGQSVLGTLMAWTALCLGFGLYAPPMVMAGHVAVGSVFLWRRRTLLLPLFRMETSGRGIHWRKEVWPFQWKIAISWLCTYLISSAFTPIVFATRGPVEAGKMGMSLNICASLGALAIAWMNTKASPFGVMIARGERRTLDYLFFRTLWQSTAMLCSGAIVVLTGLYVLPHVVPRLAQRLLLPSVFALLLVGFFVSHIVQCLAIYLRSHRKEPFLFQSLIVAALVCCGSYLCSRIWGTAGYRCCVLLVHGRCQLDFSTRYLYIFAEAFSKRMNLPRTTMKLKSYERTSLFLLWAILLLSVGCWFYFSAMRPSLTGLSDAHIGADSNRYMMMGDEVRTGNVEPWLALALSAFPSTLWVPVGLSYLLQTADWIAVFDLITFGVSVVLLWRTFRMKLQYFLPLMFLNATTLISVLSLNKEVLDLFSTALLCFAARTKRYWLMPLPLLLALLNRFEFAVILFIFLFLRSSLNPLQRRRFFCFLLLLIFLNFVVPSIGSSAVVDRMEEQKSVSVGGTAVFLNDLELHYMFLIAYPFKVALTLFGDVFNLNKISNYSQLANDYANTYVLLLNNLASLCVVALMTLRRRFTLKSDVIFLAFVISAVSSVSGVIQPRYFYMVYVMFCVALSLPKGAGCLDSTNCEQSQSVHHRRVRFVLPRIHFSW